jgi:hypothetical protein
MDKDDIETEDISAQIQDFRNTHGMDSMLSAEPDGKEGNPKQDSALDKEEKATLFSQDDFAKFKAIILLFFDKSYQKINIKKNEGEPSYEVMISREHISLKLKPDPFSDLLLYSYSLSTGTLINKKVDQKDPAFLHDFYKCIFEVCDDVMKKRAELEVE